MQSLGDAVLFLRIAAFAAAVPLLVRMPIRKLERWVTPVSPAHSLDSAQTAKIIRFTEIVCRAARPLTAHPCQVEGLTLYRFLRRAGVDVALVFGIGAVDGVGAGHCWLVKNGEPYLESADPREHFTAMYMFNSNNAVARGTQAKQGCG